MDWTSCIQQTAVVQGERVEDPLIISLIRLGQLFCFHRSLEMRSALSFLLFFPQLLIVHGRLLAAEAFGVQWPFHGAMVALSVRGGRVDTACSMQLGYFSVPECEGYVVP